MNCLLVAVLTVFIIIKKTSQTCVTVNILQRFSRLSSSRKYIKCENEMISTDFYKKVESFTTNAQIQWLEINNTKSPEIPSGAFSTLHNIWDLRITYAGAQIIQPGAFNGLSKLTQLSLRNNKIIEVNENYFLNLTYLLELDLSFNNILHVSDKSFTDLRYLRRLILQNNFITKLTPITFNTLTKLEILDISFNKLFIVDKQLFVNLTSLNSLYLNNNNLNVIDGDVLSNNKQLQNIYINNNFITTLNHLEISSSLTVFNASKNGIQFVSFSTFCNIKTVDLSYNGLENVKNLLLNNVEIREFYLDQNQLGLNPIITNPFVNLTTLETLSLKDNQIREWSLLSFNPNNKIKKLNLAKNYLQTSSGTKFPVSVEELMINFNKFDSKLNISYLTNLRILDISFNNLTQISSYFFKGLKRLYQLNMSNNQITDIKLGCFKDLNMLRELNMSNNNISFLELGAFVGLDSLYRLDLSYNKISNLRDGIFHNIRLLQVLDLSYNNVSYSVLSNAFSHLYLLREVGIAGNNWSCFYLTKMIKSYKQIKLIKGRDFDITNVDGVACKHDNSTDLINLESRSLTAIKSSLCMNNVLLILILVTLVFKIIVKCVPKHFNFKQLSNKTCTYKSEQELELVHDC